MGRSGTVVFVIVVLVFFAPVFAKWADLGVEVPVERLLANTQRYVDAHSRDARGYYTLGRLHSLAFAFAGDHYRTRVIQKGDLLQFLPIDGIRQNVPAGRRFSDSDLQHLTASVRNYTEATKLESDNSLYWLGRGWMLQQGAAVADKLGVEPGADFPAPQPATQPATRAATMPATMPADQAAKLKRAWEDAALAAYRQVLRIRGGLPVTSLGPERDSCPYYEAAAYMAEILGPRLPEAAAKKELAEVKRIQEEGKKLPYSKTPLIFRMSASERLNDLLDAARTTKFDLAGQGDSRTWPWVKADTAFLCWDPSREGKITSGRQLFGSATWWMFFENGFSALAALDDNADGVLSGRELVGIRAWIDANGDGQSDSAEMRDLDPLGIEKIDVRATTTSDGAPANPASLHLRDGRTLPLYDWTPSSLPK